MNDLSIVPGTIINWYFPAEPMPTWSFGAEPTSSSYVQNFFTISSITTDFDDLTEQQFDELTEEQFDALNE